MERIIDAFPADLQPQARGTLASSLKAVISQRLLKRADESGRVAAVEILIGTKAVSTLIREKKVHQIPSVIQTGRRDRMVLLDDCLRDLVKAGTVTAEEASRFSTDPIAAASPDPAVRSIRAAGRCTAERVRAGRRPPGFAPVRIPHPRTRRRLVRGR